MSRVGLKAIAVPASVTVEVAGKQVNVKGPKGSLQVAVPAGVNVQQTDAQLTLSRISDDRRIRSLHGLTRALISSAVTGVSVGYSKKLEVHGVGFKVNQSGQKLTLSLGFSHNVEFTVPEGIQTAVEQNTITISGHDKQRVGQVAAQIREFRKPEPYKGKGIRYEGEYIIRKAGKAASGGKE